MQIELLEKLRCPLTRQQLVLSGDVPSQVIDGMLTSEDGSQQYPIRGEIPRFVPESNYADSFGLQWNKFRKTQLDSYSGQPISADRFWNATGWNPDAMKNKWVLDAGCGAGRFAEIALSSGAKVVALDYSSAVDACWANLRDHENLHVIQGDIYALPFAPETFDFVYSLGVLQHTPDVQAAFAALPPLLGQNGQLCVDYYEKTWKSLFLPKYWLRPLTKRLPKEWLFENLEKQIPTLLGVSDAFSKVPAIGSLLKRIVPVVNYRGIYSLSEEQLYEWALLDTFDMFSPAYDEPQNQEAVEKWMKKAGLRDIETLTVGHLVARGKI